MGGGTVRPAPWPRGRARPPEGERHRDGWSERDPGRKGSDRDDSHRHRVSRGSSGDGIRRQSRSPGRKHHRNLQYAARAGWEAAGAAKGGPSQGLSGGPPRKSGQSRQRTAGATRAGCGPDIGGCDFKPCRRGNQARSTVLRYDDHGAGRCRHRSLGYGAPRSPEHELPTTGYGAACQRCSG